MVRLGRYYQAMTWALNSVGELPHQIRMDRVQMPIHPFRKFEVGRTCKRTNDCYMIRQKCLPPIVNLREHRIAFAHFLMIVRINEPPSHESYRYAPALLCSTSPQLQRVGFIAEGQAFQPDGVCDDHVYLPNLQAGKPDLQIYFTASASAPPSPAAAALLAAKLGGRGWAWLPPGYRGSCRGCCRRRIGCRC
jgi:hypothetical protein